MGGATRKAQPRRAEGGDKELTAKAMKTRSGQRARGHLGRGGLVALLLHGHLLAPLLIATFIYAAREEAQRAEEVDVGFEDLKPEELPADLPSLDDSADVMPEPPAKTKPEPKAVRVPSPPKKPDPTHKPEEKPAKQTPPPPKEAPLATPVPPAPQPPAPAPVPKSHEKMVDLDNDKDIEPPPDAKYLAQKNNRADVETRATQTNMEREQKGEEASQQTKGERQDDKEVGDDKAKIAQLEEMKSKLGRSAPDVTASKESESLDQQDRPPLPSPVLSLRDTRPRGHEITPETVDPSLPHDPAGNLARAQPRGAFHDDESEHQHDGAKRVRLALSGKDYEYLFGGEAKADRQLAQQERSTRIGKHVRAAARVRSALENFITEVKPGNQTALNTRAAPFAAFIARMHRNIHQLWGFGQLEDWDDLPASSPLNDESLATTVEIELNRDGSVNKVSMVRVSRYLPFDAAAVDVVLNAGPYPEPPREIRSGNGKVYVHWSFFRDGRQCATTGVDYFILNNGPKGGDVPGAADRPLAPVEAPPPAGPRRLERGLGEGPGRRAVVVPPGGGGVGSAPGEGSEESTPGAAAGRQDKATGDFARGWFAAFVRGDVRTMTARSIYPFRSSAGIAAKSEAELAQMLSNLVAESPRRGSTAVTVETAAGLRKLVGKLPPGLDNGTGSLYAVSSVDGDMMILLLARTSAGWRASGLVRR